MIRALRHHTPALAAALAATLADASSAASTVLRAHGRVSSAVLAFACAALFPRLPGRAQLAVLHRPGFGPLLIAAARRVVDLDRDGYSPILGGGDCDDHDARIHAGAADVPGNGSARTRLT